MNELSAVAVQDFVNIAMVKAVTFVPTLLLALVVLFLGLWFIGRLVRLSRAALLKSNTDPTLSRFLVSLLSFGAKALLLISVASMIGIATTSFIALLGAAGLAIGLALQGSLANFAGGILILMFRPFRVGEFIEAEGVSGTVHDIQILNTSLKTPDNKLVIVPNAKLSNGIVTNYSREATRRVDLTVGISYDDDIALAKKTLREIIGADQRILGEPEPLVVVSALADSSVNITVRVWVNSSDYWPVFFALTETVKTTFDDTGIHIPYPQRDLHIRNNVAAASSSE